MNTPEQVAEFMRLAMFLSRERHAGREAPRLTADRLRAFLGLVDQWRPAWSHDLDYAALMAEKFKNNAR